MRGKHERQSDQTQNMSADKGVVSPTPHVQDIPISAPPGVSVSAYNQATNSNVEPISVVEGESAYKGLEIKKKRGGLKALLITLLVVVLVAAAAYVGGAVAFSQRFLPGTWYEGQDASLLTLDEMKSAIDQDISAYTLTISGGAFDYSVSADKIALDVDSAQMAQEMLDSQNQWQWPYLLLKGNLNVSSDLKITFDDQALSDDVKKSVKAYNSDAEPSKDATVEYDDKEDAFIIVPEVLGTRYSPKKVIAVAQQAVQTLEPVVELTDEELAKPKITSESKELKKAAEEATKAVSSHITVMLDDEEAGTIGPDELHDLVVIDKDLKVTLEDDALNAWVDEIVIGYNTVGAERSYTRADGKKVTVSGGSYGWEIDWESLRDAVLDAVRAGEDTTIDVPCWSVAQAFNGQGSPDWGARYVDVDIAEQHVRFYGDKGKIIWESDCISGSPDGEHDTVEGVWYINAKESPSKLIGYTSSGKKEYETTVTYWMPFEENSIGFHDATWQPGFGGQMYKEGYGSHGCVNLPYDKAQELYNIIEYGDVVVVHS